MNKQQFLDELRQTLTGEVPANVVMESYSYYANYIEDEMRNGKSEEQVLEELGKPMLIARSIIAAQTGQRSVDYEYTEDGRTKTVKNQFFKNQEYKNNNATGAGNNSDGMKFAFNFSSVLAKTVFVILMLLLVVIFYFVIKIGFWVLITFGIPILIILGIIYLIMYFAGGN